MSEAPDYDVIVVGAGGAGLSAAVSAHQRGATVIVVEAGGSVGGSTALSGGAIMAAGTSVQREAGYVDDSPDEFFDYYLTFNRWEIEPAVIRRFCDEGAPLVDWLIELGVTFRPEDLYKPGLERVPRSHRPLGNGAALIEVLHRVCRERDIDIAFGTRVERLLTSDGEVCGIATGDQALTSASVVVTSGGLGHNQDLLRENIPDLRYARPGPIGAAAPPTNVGDGLVMGTNVGAATAGRNHALIGMNTGIPSVEPFLTGWMMVVDATGQRYASEMAPYFVLSHLTLAHGGTCWAIFDDDAARAGPPPDWRPAIGISSWVPEAVDAAAESGQITRAPDIRALADQISVPADALAATVERYNEGCAREFDAQFFKEPVALVPVRTPPFYAVQLRPGGVTPSAYGLRIDADARVLRASDYRAIPGLYAAGEVTGNVIGPQYLGGGNAVTSAVLFGRVAGMSAVADRKERRVTTG